MRRGRKTQPKTTATPGPIPNPPDWMTGPRPLELWNKYAATLNALGLLESLDAIAFAMLCEGVDAYLSASEQLTGDELVVPVGEHGALQQNPLVSIIRQQSKGVRELLAEFGMTPQSRTALTGSTSATPESAEIDPFEKLFEQFGQPAPDVAPAAAASRKKRTTKRTASRKTKRTAKKKTTPKKPRRAT